MAYRVATDETPRTLSLHHARGSTLVFFFGWVLLFIFATVNPTGLRFGADAPRQDPDIALVFGPFFSFWLLVLVRAWFLRLDVEHFERDGRLRLTWNRWPRSKKIVEIPIANVTDVVTIANKDKPRSRKGIALLVDEKPFELTTSRNGDDTTKKIAALKAFLHLATPERTVTD